MAEALLATGGGGRIGDAIASYFEVHVLRDGRWVIDCTAPRADDALAEAQDIVRKADVQGVRVVHERYNPLTDQSAARVILSRLKPPRVRGQRPVAAPAAPIRPAPATARAEAAAEPPRRPVVPVLPAPEPAPWLLFAWASLALAVTASLLFVVLLLAG